MILRSQLRMNKNIVFPFISCIMIMLTLLVLIHKSADELSAAKKEFSLCKQQQDSLYTQLQSAIEYKLRLEKSLQNEKTDSKQKIEEITALLAQEKENRRKDKEEDDARFDALNQRFVLKENENKDFNEDNEKMRKKLVDKDEEFSKLNAKLIAMRSENEQLLAAKDKIIEDLQGKLKTSEHVVPPAKKTTPETNEMHVLQGDQIQLSGNNSVTPNINPQALLGNLDPSPKLAVPPPPPLQQPNNEDHENSLQKQMRDDLNVRLSGDQKPEENVLNAPENKEKEKPNAFDTGNGFDKKDEAADAENAKNAGKMFIPMPDFGQANPKPQASSASNNIAEPARVEDSQQVLPVPNQNVKVKEIPKQMRDYVGGDYGKDMVGEDEGEEAEYMDNEVAPAQKKANAYVKEKRQEEPVNDGESVVLHPK